MTLAYRRSFRLVTATALAVALLSGCSTIKNVFDGRGKDHSKDPAKLVQISPRAVTKEFNIRTQLGLQLAQLGI